MLPPALAALRCLSTPCPRNGAGAQGLYDVGNIAAVFRSAEAFGVEEM